MSTPTRTLTDAVEDALQGLDRWAQQCHAASLALVKSGVLTEHCGTAGRVARGVCKGVGGQHSWVVAGPNVYDPQALIVDVTRWSYAPGTDRVWVGSMAADRLHTPHGSGSIWAWGRPEHGGGETLAIDPARLSTAADNFLTLIGPLDAQGWATLWSSGAMQGWPAAEVLNAFLDQYPALTGIVPIDVIGHLTNRNPRGLYLP